MTLRRPTWIERAIQIVLLLYLLLLGYEFFKALGAHACAEAVTPDCYPWGAEGPAAGEWSYETKAHYLASTATEFGVTLMAAALPFFMARPRWSLLGMLVILVGGYRLAAWLLPMLMV